MNSHRLLMFALLVFAFGLRVVHNTELLPPVYAYPNEIGKRDGALTLAEENFDHGYSMPSFLLNSLYVLYFPVRWSYEFGHAQWPDSAVFGLDLMNYYLWFGRTYMAVFGTLAVWVVYLLGRRLGGRRLGLFAAALLAVVPIAVLGSRHMKEDMPLGLFSTVAILFLADLLHRHRVRDFLRAAVAAGVCFGTKWLGGIILLPCILAAWLLRGKVLGMKGLRSRRWFALVLAGCFLLGFSITSPDFMVHPRKIWKGLKRGAKKSYDSHSDGMKVDLYENAFTDYFRTGLWPGLTPTVLLLSFGGYFWLRRRRPDEALLLASWILLVYTLLETAKARPYPHYQRYLQPIIPSLCVLAACGLEGMTRWVSRFELRLGKRGAQIVVAGIVIAGLGWPLYDSVNYLRFIPRSTIIQAREFILQQVPKDSLILIDNYGPILPAEQYRFMVPRRDDLLAVGDFPPEPCYALVSENGLGRFLKRPQANPPLTNFIMWVMSNGKLIREWRPEFRSFYCESPTLRLYKFEDTKIVFHAPPLPPED
ncbi:MAG: glycosyltransferase family 39 protein [bacterium]